MSRPVIVKAQTLTSGQTLAGTGVDLGDGWRKVYVQLATATSGSHYIQCSYSGLAGVYQRVTPMIATMNVTQYAIDSSVSNAIVEIPVAGRYAKVENSSGTTDTHTTYRFICVY